MVGMRAIIELFRDTEVGGAAGGRAGGNPVVWLNRLEGGREAGGMRLMTGGTERRVEAAEGEDRYTGQRETYEKMRYMKKKLTLL